MLAISLSLALQAALGSPPVPSRDETAVLAPPQVVALEAQSGATITGRVLDPEGEPVVPYEVAAVPVGSESLDGDAVPNWNAIALGRPVAVDDQGRFALHDLAPGGHVLFGRFAHGAPQRLNRDPIEVGTEDVTLTAAEHRIAVTVLDADGNALDTAQGYELGRSDGILRFERLDGPDLEGPVFQGRQLAVRRVEPGTRWRISYASLGSPLVEVVRDVPREPWLLRETLQLAAPVEPARLRLRMRVDDRPYSSGFEIAARTASGANAVVDPTRESWESVPLAPGAYRIEVTPTSGSSFRCGPIDPEDLVPSFGPAAFDVELAPGEEREETLVLPPCRRVAIDLARPRQGDAAALDRIGDLLETWKAIGLAPATLRSLATGLVLHPDFSVDLGDPVRASRRHLWAKGIAPGRRSVSASGIGPGRYALVVELPGGERIEREIDVKEPGITEVTLP